MADGSTNSEKEAPAPSTDAKKPAKRSVGFAPSGSVPASVFYASAPAPTTPPPPPPITIPSDKPKAAPAKTYDEAIAIIQRVWKRKKTWSALLAQLPKLRAAFIDEVAAAAGAADNPLYSDRMLALRDQLRDDPQVVAALDQAWLSVVPPGRTVMHRKVYYSFSRKLYLVSILQEAEETGEVDVDLIDPNECMRCALHFSAHAFIFTLLTFSVALSQVDGRRLAIRQRWQGRVRTVRLRQVRLSARRCADWRSVCGRICRVDHQHDREVTAAVQREEAA